MCFELSLASLQVTKSGICYYFVLLVNVFHFEVYILTRAAQKNEIL